ncbi:MAG: hypothetical protein PHU53_06160 [Thermoplasmata archaeon]|nr:hypothetical protein [Thermoplasmata archaeon]
MDIKKLMSIAIVFGMLAVSFAMVIPNNAKASFIEMSAAPWPATFTPNDVAWDDTGKFCLVVGTETDLGTPGLSNAWKYDGYTDTWTAVTGAPRAQILTSACWDKGGDLFWAVGGAGVTSVYDMPKYNFAFAIPGVTLTMALNAVEADLTGNILAGGPGGVLQAFNKVDNVWYDHSVGLNWMTKDISFNTAAGIFIVAAYDTSLSHAGILYTDTVPLGSATTAYIGTLSATIIDLKAIAWNPVTDYALAVGSGVFKITYDTLPVFMVSTIMAEGTGNLFNDVEWDTDGYNEAAIVGQNNIPRATYWRFYNTNPTMIWAHQDAAYPAYTCVSIKPPASPKVVFIPFGMGLVNGNIQEFDQSTRITANAVFPKLHWIGFNDTLFANRMDQQVIVDADYVFTLQANYSEGWDNCQAEVWAWYDNGLTGLGGSTYPAAPDATTRNLAFRITYFAVNDTAWVWYPITALEVTVGVPQDIDWFAPNADPTQNHHRVRIPVWFGNQIRSATYGGVAPAGPDYSPDPDVALNNVDSWDFNVTVRDSNNPTALATSYGEFGIQSAVSLSVTGNPSGNAPPGTTDNPMTAPSRIVYSSNAEYFVNVSIPNLYMNGVIGAPDFIPAIDVSIQNTHVDVNAGNSDFSVQTHITGANTNMYVWGAPLDVGIPPANNGLVSAGPIMTDYTTPLAAWTDLNWWVDVAPGTAEGIYWGVITISIEN